jgi:D-alanyl-D-alanine carboxypeptidase (penicillin-binding protein 5/6)
VVTPDGYDEDGAGVVGVRPDAVRPLRAAEEGLPGVLLDGPREVPGRDQEEQKGKKVRGSFEIQNTNRLLTGDSDISAYKGIAGVKNGNTTNAGSTFTGVAERGKVLLVTVMNPQKEEHYGVYKETAKLLDWGFQAAGSVKPVGTLVRPGPAGLEQSNHAAGSKKGDEHTQASVSGDSGSGGMWTAAGIAAGSLAVLGAVAYAVHRRWPRRG